MSQATSPSMIPEQLAGRHNRPGYTPPLACAVGLPTRNRAGETLEVLYPAPRDASHLALAAALAALVNHLSGNVTYRLLPAMIEQLRSTCADLFTGISDRNLTLLSDAATHQREAIVTFITTNVPPKTVEDVYLRLTLLSHRMVRPHEFDLTGIASILPTVAWTSEGAIDPRDLPERKIEARLAGRFLDVFSVDKLPSMLNYVVPTDVRVADGHRVRLGAYLGPGTTVMQEGFVNYNAGTQGPNLIQGRVSSGVTIGRGSDLGGGSSIMGMVEDEQHTRITIGENALIGANAGAGIPLGDNCVIEAGLYVTAGSKVKMLDVIGQNVGSVKAIELAGRSNLLFRRNSTTGAIEAVMQKTVRELGQ